MNYPNRTTRRPGADEIAAQVAARVVGQPDAVNAIAPYVELFQAGLSPEGRPAGVFLLLGPTGTGKTRTIEALADVIHGSERNILRVDCGEFQLDHEVAKLIGAPPGYLGHRETHPMLSQQKVNTVSSDRSNLSLVLFDEIEKAAPSMARLLLGVLDKASLKLGDNTTVNFERTLIFMTSNLGAREMMREMTAGLGFCRALKGEAEIPSGKLQAIAERAMKRRFSPEFVNRIDRTITYRPLERPDLERILDLQMADLRRHLFQRLGVRAFDVELTAGARDFLLTRGTSPEHGARELKRVIHRYLLQPIAGLVMRGETDPGGRVRADRNSDHTALNLRPWPLRRRDAA
jgi:ATP-dependent Clp protease ATP-binding subunit ClpA